MLDVQTHQSGIEGLGIFAGRPFRAGERIHRINVLREVTAAAPLREDLGERQDHCAYPNGRTVLYGPPDRYTNHSCDPNAYEVHESDAIYLVARRRIAAGDEITCDYNINIANGTAWPCRCGAARCQGQVMGDFFRLPVAWQRDYRSLLAPWFVAAHQAQLRALDGRA
jgi:histone-lysine N-methyltransferase SETD1